MKAPVLRLRPLIRTLVGFLLFVALLLALVWIALPRWLSGRGMALASEALGRTVSVAQVRFEPWRLGLVLEGLRVDAADRQLPPLLAVERVDLALSLRSLAHAAPVLESLRVEHPVLRLARTAEGHYDVDDLLQKLSAPSPRPDSGEPARFALYNLQLQGGELVFDDQPVKARHVLDQLSLSLPFVSSFAADVQVHVTPQLSGRLNGTAFGSSAQAEPFLQGGEGEARLKFSGLDLAPYLGYLPAAVPVHINKGRLDAELQLRFEAQRLQLGGRLALADFAAALTGERSRVDWRRLDLAITRLAPLQRELALGLVKLEGATVSLDRDPAGGFGVPGGTTRNTAPAPPSMPWKLALDRLELDDAALDWHDRRVQPAAQLRIDGLKLSLDALRWPLAGTAQLHYALRIGDAAIQGQGSLQQAAAELSAQWQDLALEPFMPYAGGALRARVKGRLDGQMQVKVGRPLEAGVADRIELSLDGLSLRDLALVGASAAPVLTVARVGLASARVLPGEHKVELGALKIEKPRLDAARVAAGRLNLLALLPPAAPATASPGVRSAAPDWALTLAGLALEQGSLRWRDALAGEGVDVEIDQLALQLGALDWPRSRPTKARLALRLGATGDQPAQRGALQLQGRVGLAPLMFDGTLSSRQLPLQAWSAYLDPSWNLRLRRAELGLKGRLSLQQKGGALLAGWQGDALLSDLRLQQLRDGDGQPLLSWGALNLDSLDLALKPGEAPRVAMKQLRLDDFFARLLVNEQGQLNLKEIGPGGAAVTPGQAASAAAVAPTPLVVAAPASAPLAGGPGPAVHLSVGATLLSKGRVDFTDHFIRPNYSAELSELEGHVGGFSSDLAQMADIDLRGRVAGTGLLSIGGKLNPATQPPLMDMAASASDIELAPLSPYAAKYAGYEIARGKLSTQVHYRIDTGGKLEADNQLVLNQLEFGQAVDSPDATKLPVRLAVALLKDSHGVIDIQLPIHGSVNDPEFSVGGIIVKLIFNLLGKALTAPFSLFSGGGSSDLSQLACVPGEPVLADAGQLDTLATMLRERPALTLTIFGEARLDEERAAMEAQALEAAVQREQRRELRRKALGAAQAASEPQALPPQGAADHERLLRLVYEAAKLPDKPRNFIGMAKEIPAEQMRTLLLPSYAPDAQAVRELALQRSVGVRDALVARGIASSRLFLGAPQQQGATAGAPATEAGKAWQPRVELRLSVP